MVNKKIKTHINKLLFKFGRDRTERNKQIDADFSV